MERTDKMDIAVMSGANTCISCGDVIPEGIWECPVCLNGYGPKAVVMLAPKKGRKLRFWKKLSHKGKE